MNKVIIILLILICNCLCIIAQSKSDNEHDKVYLKNGRIFIGVLLDDDNNSKFIRIKVERNGKDSIYVFSKNEIELVKKQQVSDSSRRRKKQLEKGNVVNSINIKTASASESNPKNQDYDITNPIREAVKQSRIEQPAQKEEPMPISYNEFTQGLKSGDVTGENIDLYSLPPLRPRKIWNRDIVGFRAFTDQIGILGIGNENNNRYAFAQSLGIQFNPIIYLGVGIEYDLSLNNKENSAPIFINPRINFLDNNITPFLDLRSGWSFWGGQGFYGSVTGGVSFAKGTSAWNIGAGYSFQRVKYDYRPDNNKIQTVTTFDNYHGFFLKLTFEFNLYRF